MTVADESVVDQIGIEPETDAVVLTIADHLDWADERGHLSALQNKLNTYLRFVESGEIGESYPKAIGKQVVIEVVFRFPVPEGGRAFLARVEPILRQAGFELRTAVFEGKAASA